MCRSVTIAAHYNVDSNLVKAQIYISDDCDSLFHPEDVVSGSVQLYNVYNLPETGLQEVPLEQVGFDSSLANADGYFSIFFLNPSMRTRLEARSTVDLGAYGELSVTTTVLDDEGTYSDQPSTSVVGTVENPSWHLDKYPQRDGYELEAYPHVDPTMDDDQTVTLDPIVQVLHADIQFEKLAEVRSTEQLPGSLSYIGGGDRLLPKPGVLVYQPVDTPPWELGTSTFTERAATELLPNNQFLTAANSGYPTGYGLIDSPGIAVVLNRIQTLQAEGFSARAWSVQLNGAVPTSISPFNTAKIGVQTPIPFDVTKPISLSILAGLTKNVETSSISSAKLVFTFYDFADREITSMSQVLDVDDMFNARPLKPFSISARVSDYPPTTEKISWKLELAALEQGDFITLTLALPSMAQTASATSQTLSTKSRLVDNLNYAPNEPFNLDSGAVVLSLAIGFEGAPTEEKFFFDTRTTVTLLNGVALRAEPTGELTLIMNNGTSTQTLTSSVVSWVAGEVTEVVAEWSVSPALRRLSVNGDVVATDSSPLLTGLDVLNISSIQLGSDANVSKQLDSEFLRATFLRRPRS